MQSGYVKVWRKLLESPIMQHDGMLRAWMFCLMKANWKESKWLIPGTLHEFSIPRGSFVTGRESFHNMMYPARDQDGRIIHREYTPTSRTVWRWLEALCAMGCLNMQNMSNRCTMITVCNFRTYQDSDEALCPTGVQPVSNRCPTGVQPVSTIEEEKEREECKKEKNTPLTPQGGGRRKQRNRSDPEEDPLSVVMPVALDTHAFRRSWEEWISYRRAHRYSTRSQTVVKQLDFLAPHGAVVASQIIDQSIRNGWQGLFPLKSVPKQANGFFDGFKEFLDRGE